MLHQRLMSVEHLGTLVALEDLRLMFGLVVVQFGDAFERFVAPFAPYLRSRHLGIRVALEVSHQFVLVAVFFVADVALGRPVRVDVVQVGHQFALQHPVADGTLDPMALMVVLKHIAVNRNRCESLQILPEYVVHRSLDHHTLNALRTTRTYNAEPRHELLSGVSAS